MDFSDINWPVMIIIAVVIGLIVGLIATLIMKSKHKSVRAKTEANSYVVDGSFVLSGQSDTFLYSEVEQIEKPRNDDHDDNDSDGGFDFDD